MKEIKDYINRYSSLLSLSKSISMPEAELRAGEFLSAMATIADWKHVLAEDKIRLMSIQTATYAQKLSEAAGKTITENKIMAEASEEYTKAREDLERIENDIAYLKAYYDIFNNGHIFYRTMAKGNNDL